MPTAERAGWSVLAIPIVLLSCAPSPQTALAATQPDAVCRAAPDGAPVPDARHAERGIGGTGGRVADRGIGGTGIIGTITGFASICVNGIEVGFDAAASVQVDGTAASAASLRAGQLAVIAARGTPRGLGATTIAIRHEVVGPVERGRDGSLSVAGQRIVLPDVAWVMGVQGRYAADLHDGAFVAVSGLRRPDGGIVASRIDDAISGPILVRGVLSGDAASARIGELALRLRPGLAVPALHAVTVTGRYDGTLLAVDTLTADLPMGMPTMAFGGAQRLSIEAVVRLGADHVTFADGETARRPARIAPPASFDTASPEIAVVDLVRGSDGAFTVAHLAEPPGLGPRNTQPSAGGDGPRPPGPRMPGDPSAGPGGGLGGGSGVDHGGGPPVH